MKKLTCVLSVFALSATMAYAKPVKPATAQTIAENFYKQNSKIELVSSTLVYTEVSAGLPVYYVFDINTNDGFVIVAAESVAHPIIGYSTSKHFVIPNSTENTNIGYWLKSCSTGINTLRAKGRVLTSAEIALEWEKYISNRPQLMQSARLTGHASTTSANPVVAPLCQTIWNQSPLYNALCPGPMNNKAVTGCVATAMAQIMRYWSYPATGTGSSSYCDCTPNYSNNYGTLSANYGATTYNWANMPYNVTSANNDVATLMYHCGVSVDMDYDPSGSGAEVITADNPICAQHSYVTYFKYNPSTISGLRRSGHSESTWLALIENDLDLGRPVQYVGDDPSEGGHTWVCDGYDQNNYLHMNWGWGGQSDGFFQVDSLTTPGFDPSANHEAVLGIVPMTSNAMDAGIPAITQPIGYYCNNVFNPSIQLQNYGSTTLISCDINYQIDGGVIQTQSWSGSLVSYQSTSISLPTITLGSGTHTLTCFSSNPNGASDQNATNDQYIANFTITNIASLPVVEGFESATSLPNSNWNVSHTSTSGGTDFTISSGSAATGSNSAMLDNMNNVAGNRSYLQTSSYYDLTTLSNPVLSFKAAYQQKATTNTDMLQVLVSTDCGAIWVSKRAIPSATLASLAGGTGSATYVPTPSQYTTYTVNIASVAHNPSVLFRWSFVAGPSGPGNNLYMDDINIVDAAAAGIQSIEANVGLNIYPNPSTGKVNIDLSLTEQHTVSVNVTDMLGRTVESIPAKLYQSGEMTLPIGCNTAYQAGVYLVNINLDGQRITKKIVIQ